MWRGFALKLLTCKIIHDCVGSRDFNDGEDKEVCENIDHD